MEVTVDIMVPLTVRVDLVTGDVHEVNLHLDGFQSAPPGRYRSVDDPTRETPFRDVFFGPSQNEEGVWVDWPKEIDSREICDGEHPLADLAFSITDRVSIDRSEREIPVRFSVEPETDEQAESRRKLVEKYLSDPQPEKEKFSYD